MTRFIQADNPAFRYEGRIDYQDPAAPLLIQAGSAVYLKHAGESLSVRITVIHHHFENALGVLVDGKESKIVLNTDGATHDYPIPLEGENGKPREIILWKRGDGGAYYCAFHGVIIGESDHLESAGPAPKRRIECYGDSVSAGEICEAVSCTGKLDPDNHGGLYSNAWHSYSMMCARKLGAEIHNNAQGGIAVLDHTGFFVNGTVGLISTWDKLRYSPEIGPCSSWDFSTWTPHVVVFALGQNDAYPVNYINTDPVRRNVWKDTYASIIKNLRARYPRALFVIITTLMQHDEGWDRALDAMTEELRDERIVRYRFARNGRGTPGHPRISEHAEMAGELANFIESFGEKIWA